MPVSPTPITPLGTPPSTRDPANFDTRADTFLDALPVFAAQANDIAAKTFTNAAEAQASAASAASSKDAAAFSAGAASTACTEAQSAASAAGTSETNAAASETAAGTSETNAAASAVTAAAWATKTDGPVAGGEYSAKKHAADAAASAADAAASAASASAITGLPQPAGQDGKVLRVIGNAYALDPLGDKQATLVSGTNIKTVNGHSLLGGGNMRVISEPTATSMEKDATGRITKTTFTQDGTPGETAYSYDANGLLSQAVRTHAGITRTTTFTYTTDVNGHSIVSTSSTETTV